MAYIFSIYTIEIDTAGFKDIHEAENFIKRKVTAEVTIKAAYRPGDFNLKFIPRH